MGGEVHVAARGRSDRRDEVASRCPFCREDVRLEAGAWLACALCLARHHQGCWRELGRCASCGDGAHLAPVAAVERIPGALGLAARALDLVHRLVGVLIGGAGVALLLFALLFAWAPDSQASRVSLAAGSIGLGLVGAGLGLRAASLRWGRRPRRLPLPLFAALVLLGSPPPLAATWAGQPAVALWALLVVGGWWALVGGVALACVRGAPATRAPAGESG